MRIATVAAIGREGRNAQSSTIFSTKGIDLPSLTIGHRSTIGDEAGAGASAYIHFYPAAFRPRHSCGIGYERGRAKVSAREERLDKRMSRRGS